MADETWFTAGLIINEKTLIADGLSVDSCETGCTAVHVLLLAPDDRTVLAIGNVPVDAIDSLCAELQRRKAMILGQAIPNCDAVGHA